jgi:tRNA A-37 threonylcarbamoyl transferase component Bud32
MSAAPGLAPGALFAQDYRVVAPLSAGAMGEVYVAEHRFTGQRCALKLMHPELVADPILRQRFEQEARIGSRIESDHVVHVIGAGVDGETGAPWLAMELLVGADLATVMERRGVLAAAEARAVLEDVCHALAAAHRAGVVHRDLKPANIFWADVKRTRVPFTVKVLDFGIAKIVADAGPRSSSAGLGTPMWMAPEQTGAGEVTKTADVWAIGLLAFHLLTGRFFWRVLDDRVGTSQRRPASVQMLLQEVLLDPIPPASTRAAELGVTVPAGFDAWFARCVARDPADRFPDAGACFAGIEPILAHASRSDAPPPHELFAPSAPSLALAETDAAVRVTPAIVDDLALRPTEVPETAPMPRPRRLEATATTSPGVARQQAPPTAALPIAIGAAVTLGAALVAGVVAWSLGAFSRSAAVSIGGAPAPATTQVCPAERCVPFVVADLAHVEALDLVPQAKKLAVSVDPSAELVMVNVTGASVDGTVDFSAPSPTVGYHFSGRSGVFVLQTYAQRFTVTHYGGQAMHAIGEGVCSARAARKAAGARIPANAFVRMQLLHLAAYAAPVWQVSAQTGPNVLLDARTCTPR